MKPHPIARQLAQIRRDKNLSQAQLALRLHVIQKTISHREVGHSTHGLHEIDQHARALGYRLALIPTEGSE